MNRIAERFSTLRARRRKGFIVYLGAGDPDLEATRQLALAFDQLGVDVLELGIPFSDPLADGVVNQLSAQRGLASGTTPAKVLETVQTIRRDSAIPIVLYIYYNLVHRYGVQAFIQDAAQAGVDGLLVLDLPPEEGGEYERLMSQAGLCAIYLVAPTTPEGRIQRIVEHGSGFVYYVSREGVTGMRDSLASNLGAMMAAIRRHTTLPVAIGFGISTPDQARAAASHGDAVVVGSAIVNQVAQFGRSAQLVPGVKEFVKPLIDAVKHEQDQDQSG